MDVFLSLLTIIICFLWLCIVSHACDYSLMVKFCCSVGTASCSLLHIADGGGEAGDAGHCGVPEGP